MQPEFLIAVARVVLGLFFIIAAFRNTRRFAFWTSNQTNYGWPLPAPILAIGFALQLLCGIALVINMQVIPAALALIVFLLIATPLFHNPLMFKPQDRGLHIYLDLVNLVLIAFLVQIIALALPTGA